jgi:hypothetical protein
MSVALKYHLRGFFADGNAIEDVVPGDVPGSECLSKDVAGVSIALLQKCHARPPDAQRNGVSVFLRV